MAGVGFGGLDILAIYIAFKLNYRAARAARRSPVSRAEIIVRKVTATGRMQEFRFNPQWARLEMLETQDEGVVRVAIRARDSGWRSASSSIRRTARASPAPSARRSRPRALTALFRARIGWRATANRA